MANYHFARSCGQAPGPLCGCAEPQPRPCAPGCAYEPQPDCACAVPTAPPSREAHRTEPCLCCKLSLRDALKLLCCGGISELVNYDAFAFLTEASVIGATPVALAETDTDNLGTLTGTFRRFSACSCDTIDIAGTVLTPFGTAIDASGASLCALSAIVFDLLPAPAPDPDAAFPADTDALRYRRVRELLQKQLSCTSDPCGACRCQCDCSDDCCCAEGILNTLSGASLSARTTLTAGLLAVRGVTVLGTVGNVLVLANETLRRFYFVCAAKIDFFV